MPTIIRRRFQRSASTPPNVAKKKIGICPAKPTQPRRTGECVSRYTSHCCATDCIHVPISEINCPKKTIDSSGAEAIARYLNERQAEFRHPTLLIAEAGLGIASM